MNDLEGCHKEGSFSHKLVKTLKDQRHSGNNFLLPPIGVWLSKLALSVA